MNSSNKPFSKELYNECDTPAKNAAIELLQQIGFTLLDSKESYTHDVVMERNGKQIKFEAEMTKKWTQQSFPYRDVHIPLRKQHNTSKYYLRFNNDYTACLTAPMSIIKKAPVKYSSNIYMQNEPFLTLEPNQFRHWVKIDNIWISS